MSDEAAKTETMVCGVKCRIVKPIDKSWDDVGPRLRELSWIAHRALNGTMARLALASECPDMVPDSWRSKRNENSEKRPGGKPSAYQMTKVAIEQANAHRKAGPVEDIPSAIQAGWQRLADRRYKADRRDVLLGAKSLPSFRSPAPIAITSSGEAWTLRHDGRGYVLSIPLWPGGAEGRVDFALGPDGRGAHEHMRRMVGGAAKLGDAKVLAPKNGKKGWITVLTYSWEREIPTPRSGPPIILRAIGADIVVCSPLGKPGVVYGGGAIRHKRQAFSARRSSRSKHQRDIGGGARGHGEARALQHYHAVDDAEQRWLRSICQEIAAKAVRRADRIGASWIMLDEESVRPVLPPATLRSALEWALHKSGYVEPAKLPAGGNPGGKGDS